MLPHKGQLEQSGMRSHKIDSHHIQYHVTDAGFVTAEGDVQKVINGPYEIDCRTLPPCLYGSAASALMKNPLVNFGIIERSVTSCAYSLPVRQGAGSNFEKSA